MTIRSGRKVTAYGINMVLANGSKENILTRLANGEEKQRCFLVTIRFFKKVYEHGFVEDFMIGIIGTGMMGSINLWHCKKCRK